MKPYHTSFLRAAALMMLLCSLSFCHIPSAHAQCRFSVGTADTAWSFSAAAGATQSRTLIITNVSDSTITVTAGIVSGSPSFGLNHDQFILTPGDTASVIITFLPASNTTATSITGMLRLATSNNDCRHYLTLVGSITSNHGGHDKVVTLTPTAVDFPAVAVGADTCQVMYLVNYTGAAVKISSIALLHPNNDFTISPAFNGVAIDSGGYYRFEVCCTGDANHTEFSDSLVVTYDNSSVYTLYALLVGHTAANTTGAGDALIADPHAFSFGDVAAGTTSCHSVVVTNKSKSNVVIGGWNLCNSAVFSVTPGFNGNDTLPAGGSMTFTICYTPVGVDSNIETCSLGLKYFAMDSGAVWKSLSVSFYGINPGTNHSGGDACLSTEQGTNYHDAVVIGGSANHTLYLINHTSHTITLNTFDIYGTDASVFSIDSKQFPLTVPANSTNTTLLYTFSPTSNSKTEFNAYAAFSLSGDSLTCDSVTAHLIGYTVQGSINTVDTVVRPLFPNEKRTLGVEGNGATVSTTFYFTNNLTVDCTVNKIYLANGTYFKISSTNPTPTPFVLHPGDNLTVIITYTATDKIVHHDSLMIDANHNLLAQGFELQGVQLGAASVNASLPEGVAINVSPNPASSFLTVDMAGVSSADIQIYDLLGKNIATAKASSTWKWNASNIVAGSYIVRIAGQSANGEQFVASKRIIVSK